MSHMHSFMPEGATSLIAVTSTPSTAAQISSGNVAGVLITNLGSVVAYIAMGSSTVSAALPSTSAPATGSPVLPNSAATYEVRPGFYLSAVTSAGTAALYATPGSGL